jgi:transcriptional regulator with XRE-family HTH domain
MPKSPREKFSENLRHIRAKRGMSQEKLAYLTEMPRTRISLLERGKREPWLGALIRLSAVLEVPMGEFFEGINWPALVPAGPTVPRRFIAVPVKGDPVPATPTAAQLDEWLDRM